MEAGDDATILRTAALAVALVLGLLAAAAPEPATALWLTLPAAATKCVSEEIQANVIVLADYSVVRDDHPIVPTISAKVYM